MVDCGVHQIDLARWWLGSEVVRWTAAGAWIDAFDAPDHVYLHMEHANRAQTMVEMSYSYCHTSAEPVNVFTYEFIGTEGVIRYDRGQKLFEVRSVRGTEKLPFASEKNFAGIKNMNKFPDCLVIVDTDREKIATAEAKKLKIPIVGMVDTNCDPDGIDYPIPANDDTIRSVKLIISRLVDGILEGRKEAIKPIKKTKKEASSEETKPGAELKASGEEKEEKESVQ